MSRTVPPQDNLDEIFSRIQTAAFIVVVGGLLMLTLASTLGEEITRTLVLGTLAIVFILAGSLFGLMAMSHLSQTHLPEDPEEPDAITDHQPVFSRVARRPRGFLGLFASGLEDAPVAPSRHPEQVPRVSPGE